MVIERDLMYNKMETIGNILAPIIIVALAIICVLVIYVAIMGFIDEFKSE